MPLTWLGQLKPTMEQQVALQRALLALVREDEKLRKEPALARRLVSGAGPAGAGRPTYRPPVSEKAPPWAVTFDWAGAREEALARQLRGAQPTPGYISGEERMRTAREEIAAGKEEIAGKAGEFWERITPLDDEGRKIALDAVREHQPQLYDALIEQGFVDPATGEAVRPEREKEIAFRDTRITEGWEYEDITYKDGTTESRILGPAPKEEVEVPKLSEQVALARLQFDVEKYGQSNVEAAMKQLGNVPILGATMRRPGTTAYREVKQEDVNAYYAALEDLSQYIKVSRMGPQTVEDIAALYKNNPEAIKTVQQQLGVEPTGVWSDELGQALHDIFSREE